MQLEELKNIYLEDSYVLGIQEEKYFIVFKMEFVLTEEHPSFSIPKNGEMYCYKRGNLVFSNIELRTWLEKTSNVNIDANNEEDLGNIDTLRFKNNSFYLEGDWGKLEIKGGILEVEMS